MFIAWSGIIALSWIGALVAGVPFRPTAVPNFVVVSLVGAPFFPAMFWLKLHGQVRPWERMGVVMFPAICGGMMPALAGSVPALRTWLLSPIGLAVALTALAASLLLYRAALFNFYRRGDLLQRAKSRSNFSLV